jgi:hypothetical protein
LVVGLSGVTNILLGGLKKYASQHFSYFLPPPLGSLSEGVAAFNAPLKRFAPPERSSLRSDDASPKKAQ